MRYVWQIIARGYDRFDQFLIRTWTVVLAWACRLWSLSERFLTGPARRLYRRWQPPVARLAGRLGNRLGILLAYVPLRVGMGLFALLIAGLAWLIWSAGHPRLLTALRFPDYEVPRLLRDASILGILITISRLAAIVSAASLLAAIAAMIRHPVSLWLLKAAAAGYAILVVMLQGLIWQAPASLHARDPEQFAAHLRNEVWVGGTIRLLLLIVPALLFLFVLTLRAVSNTYRREQSPIAALGDRIWRNLRTHGRDPRFRKALYLAVQLHLFVILILPFLLTWWGCRMQPYGIPKGSGVTAIQVVKVVQKQEKVEERKYVFDMDTAISFYVPKIDESEVFEEVSKMTEHTYTAQEVGRLGAGGGTTGGWPHGMEDAKVRFIRLQYDGGSWDQNMGYGSDYNILLVFRELTGFNIWHETEAIRIPQLRRFPRRRAPPFVYLAGGYHGSMTFSNSDIRTLRHYCLDMGGMIFADNGGGRFDRDFRNAMRQAFPELPLVEIPHDDVIFQAPFRFPSGAPPLWHLSGTQAMGIRHRGRWVVFYHQGNMGAAWRDGHSDAQPHVVAQAYQLGINLIAYSFNQYMQINFGGAIPR